MEVARKVGWSQVLPLSNRKRVRKGIFSSLPQSCLHAQSRNACPKKPTVLCHTRWNPRTRRKEQSLTVAHASGITALPAIIIAACTTVCFLAAAVICIIIMLRPLLKRLESLAVAAEAAAREMEKASVEFTLASMVINNDLPTTLDSMERASLEFEELGQSLNGLTGGLRKKPAATKAAKENKGGASDAPEQGKPASVAVYEMNPVEAIQASTINSMRKVAQDVSSLTAALTPAMVAWRKRLGFITERFEAASKDGKLKELPASAAESKEDPKVAEETPPLLPQGKSEAPEKEGPPQPKEAAPTAKVKEEPLEPAVKPESEALEEARGMGEAAKELAKAAEEVAEVARVSRSSIDEDLDSAPGAHRGADLLEKAAEAAQALTKEAQKAVDVETTFKQLKDLGPFPEDFSILRDGMPASSSDSEIQRQQALDKELEERRIAAQAVYSALANAEEAASAAAAASGALEKALQKVEQDAGRSWWGWNSAPSSARKHSKASSENSPGSEVQEFDGMAYPSSPYIAARRSVDSDDEDIPFTPPPTPATSTSAKR